MSVDKPKPAMKTPHTARPRPGQADRPQRFDLYRKPAEKKPVAEVSEGLPDPSREFKVTHLSDNWKIRKGAKVKGEGQTANKPAVKAEGQTTDKPTEKVLVFTRRASLFDKPGVQNPLTPGADRRQSVDDVILYRQKESVKDALNKIRERKQSLQVSIDTSLSTKPGAKLMLKSRDPKFRAGHRKSLGNNLDQLSDIEDELFEDELVDELSDDEDVDPAYLEDDASSGYSDTYRDPEELNSDDYDTDLSGSEAKHQDPEDEKKKKKHLNMTLQNYKTACAQGQLKPNPTFLRQCGRHTLDIRHRMLTEKDARPIAVALVGDKKTSFLDLSDNHLGPKGVACIAEMMSINKGIIEMNLSNTQPGTEGLQSLTKSLQTNKNLRRLFLDSNRIDQSHGEIIGQLITNVPELRELYLSNNALGFAGGKKIAMALAADKGNLTVLDLQYNNIRTDSAIQIAMSLSKNTTLRSLNLAWNGLGAEGSRALGLALGANNSLSELDISYNRLGLGAIQYLTQGLSKNTGLTTLKIGHNPMTTEGVKLLLKTIVQAEKSGIEHLDLKGIPLDAECHALIQQLKTSRNVYFLHDSNIHMATTDQTKSFDGTNLDRFDPAMVMFEYMKKDNLRVIDLFQFLDAKKRDKLSRNDIRSGFNILMIPFTEHAIDEIMTSVDTNKDGYITLDEMTKAYQISDRMVKLRRIRAAKKKRKDLGLEDLWKIIKEIINKRKVENEKRTSGGQ
ncbi:leucine-rich repeat-containing protein 74A-like [Physella acuta]|uniref:leucine-rich repeat-containing protein 74A-like n=1 Tax=Physella acuta TaxID=109671 RepID=UPI0027DB7347|nr:leucine-rich repeat-containing protein 74A-like [Physella acuta]XP_059153040.1 leucine-rich repeat-containing protein 74A-like [Physella acuta]XP_059153047.1 leucine-rich repeat-containing protein 74A-like [Physella acuta]XP_059153055.1 leucine-rich repeat-containing protein 74A-like [Physella acuta]